MPTRRSVDPKKILESRRSLHASHQTLAMDKKIDQNINDYKALLDDIVPERTRKKILDQYKSQATIEEQKLINDMLGYLTNPEDIAHFFLGAHIQLEGDDGKTYKTWHNKFGDSTVDGGVIPGKLISRSSSHVSVDTQYGLNGKVAGHILFGTRYDSNDSTGKHKYTWVQLENNPIGGFKEFKNSPISFVISAVLHFLDYLNYKITSRNIGRWGASKYTEKNPLRVNVQNLDHELAAKRSAVWQEIIFARGGRISGLETKMREVGIKLPPSNPALEV